MGELLQGALPHKHKELYRFEKGVIHHGKDKSSIQAAVLQQQPPASTRW